MVLIRLPYARHKKSQEILIITFSEIRLKMFREIAERNIGYAEISKQYCISKHRARTITGQTIYWLKRLAQETRDEEMETITLRRETYENQLTVRQYLEKYGAFLIKKIDYYQGIGRIRISKENIGTQHEWIVVEKPSTLQA